MISLIKKMFGIGNETKVIEHGAIIVDVRSKAEYASGHLKGAVNIPLEVVENRASELKKYPQVVVYCRSGNRSVQARRFLMESGLTNVLDAGSLSDARALVDATGSLEAEIIKEVIPVTTPKSKLKDTSVMKVLIPTDFSVQADYSYLMVKKLEEQLSVEIHFLHIMDVPDTVTMDVNGNIDTCGEIDVQYVKDQKNIAQQKLDQLKNQYGSDIKLHLRLGKVTDTIVTFSSENQFDLIVMGTKGSWGIQEKLVSTQAQLIARKSEVPLLSLMCDRSDLVINDVLLVHDFLEDDRSEMPLMQKFSEFFEANYHFLYIHDGTTSINNDGVEKKMDEYAEAHGLSKFQKHIIESNNVENGVKSFLKIQDADIVFVGTHGKGGFFHKSAAETLIKHLFKPIISFHLNTK
ncbi:MAG: universal stress protein [Saprospiraceae bacterium]|nr:universal stress protein [Saprospiraceae bacterium]